MVKCSGDLYQRLKEALFGFDKGEPHGFPVFMSLEELLRAIAVEAFGERAGSPIEVCAHTRKWKGR